jgi:hypothetical protein
MPIWRRRLACKINKFTETHSEYVKTFAFLLPQWLRERASTLRYTYVACLMLFGKRAALKIKLSLENNIKMDEKETWWI